MRENRILEIEEGSFVGVDLKNDDPECAMINVRGEELKLSPDDARGLAKWLLKNLNAVDTTQNTSHANGNAVQTKDGTASTVEPLPQKNEKPQPNRPGLDDRTATKTDAEEKKVLAGVQFHDYSNRLPKNGIPVKFKTNGRTS